MLRGINLFIAALFALSAALQYNDPDPALWILVYSLAAVSCLQYGRHSRDHFLPALSGLAALSWAASLVPALIDRARLSDLFRSMDDKGGAAELAREFAGLAIIAAWMIVLVVAARRRGRNA